MTAETRVDAPRETATEAAYTAARFGRLAYVAQALSLVFFVISLWIEIYIDTNKAAVIGVNAFHESHRLWRLRSSMLLLVWSILGGLSVPLGFGWLVLAAAYAWFLLRTVRGWFNWRRHRPVGVVPHSRPRVVSN